MYPEMGEEVRTYSAVVSELETLLEEFMDREAERFASVGRDLLTRWSGNSEEAST